MTKTRNVIKSADFAVLVLLWLAKNSRMFICITQFVSFAWNRAHITMMMMIVLFINQLEASYRMRSSNLLFMLSASQKQHGPREKLNMKHKWCFFYKYQTLIFSLFSAWTSNLWWSISIGNDSPKMNKKNANQHYVEAGKKETE